MCNLLLLCYAHGIASGNSVACLQAAACCAREGLQRKARRKRIGAFRGLGAESPVFCGQGICCANSLTAKNAPEVGRFPIGNLYKGR
jgi:hypothetical protein